MRTQSIEGNGAAYARKFILALLLGAALLATGCTRREEAVESSGVRASPVYLKYFGVAPTVKEGTCFARVGFFPLSDNPGQVRPIPLFLFSEERQMEKIARHLMAMKKEVLGDGLFNPFPPGTDLKSLTVQGDTAEVRLIFADAVPSDPFMVQGMASSIGHSLAQYPQVARIRIYADETLLPGLDPDGFLPDPKDVFEPQPPRPLSVAGTWEKGEDAPEEVSVFFDRPVNIDQVEISVDGSPLAGDFYQSVFDMAVVVHPARPEILREGSPVRLRWKMTDRLGRLSEGETVFSLQRLEHPESSR